MTHNVTVPKYSLADLLAWPVDSPAVSIHALPYSNLLFWWCSHWQVTAWCSQNSKKVECDKHFSSSMVAILATFWKGRDQQRLFKLVKMAAKEGGHIIIDIAWNRGHKEKCKFIFKPSEQSSQPIFWQATIVDTLWLSFPGSAQQQYLSLDNTYLSKFMHCTSEYTLYTVYCM